MCLVYLKLVSSAFSRCAVYQQQFFSQSSPLNPLTLTLLDARSSVGTNLALLLKQNPLLRELRIYDETQDTCGLALDLENIDTSSQVKAYKPQCLKSAVEGSHIVISTGDCQDKPNQTQKALFEKNVDNVRNVAMFLSEFNSNAIYCIAKPPVEALVPLVCEEYKRAEKYDTRKIIGVTTTAAMIANTFIAKHLNVDPLKVLCPIIGGLTPETAIPVISQIRPPVQLNETVYKNLQNAIVKAEENLLKNNTFFCYSKVVAIARFVNLLLQALHEKAPCVECAFVAQHGHIGKFLPYMTSIVKLGPEGIISTHMPKLSSFEISRLQSAMLIILQNISLGQKYFQGHYPIDSALEKKKNCDWFLKRKIRKRMQM